ncbi:MAG: hypothetical protein PUD81_08475 [Eggerthellales bacterium]|nr:hypothetical protein [Eggerthellales bacterium]
MYNEDTILLVRQAYKLTDARGMSIEVMEEDLAGYVEKFGVSLQWQRDQIEVAAGVQDCLVLFNPDHKDDYYNIVATFQAPTKLAVLTAFIAGESASGMSQAAALTLLQGGKMALANMAATEDAAECEYYADLYNIVNALIGASQV